MATSTPFDPWSTAPEPVRWTLWQQQQQCGAQVPPGDKPPAGKPAVTALR